MIGFIIESHASATSKVPTALSILDQTFKLSVAKMATPTSILLSSRTRSDSPAMFKRVNVHGMASA